MLRLFSDLAGNDYGLYYPRDGGRPFAVYHDHEEYMLVPLTSNLDEFFGDPDSWAVDNPSNERTWWESPTKGWRRLFVNPETSRPPELEVLKPMHLHYRHLEKSAMAGWKRGIFARLFRRWGAYNPKLEPMRNHFRCAGHFEDWRRWLSAAEEFAWTGAGREALLAFDNAHAVKHTAPFWDLLPGSTDLELFRRGWPILKKFGDAFDRAMGSAQVRRARRRLKEK